MLHRAKHTKSALATFGCVLAITVACTNEPYTLLPLGVTLVQTAGTVSQYTYRNQRIASFIKLVGGDTTSMKFYYSAEGIDRIVIDSTATGYSIMQISGPLRTPTQDSLFNVTPLSSTLVQARRFSYNGDQTLSQIDVSVHSDLGITSTRYKIEWTNGNITRITRETTDLAGELTTTTLAVGHDNRKGVYSSDAAYLYTISLDELYWLSTNNPVTFQRDTLDEVSYRYFYNTFGYPTHIRTDRGVVIGHTYTELR